MADEPLERRLAQVVVAAGQRADRADQVADARDVRGVAADAELGAARDDLHAELVLDALDVRLVLSGDEHHLVGIGDEDRDLLCVRHYALARSFNTRWATAETTRPSA